MRRILFLSAAIILGSISTAAPAQTTNPQPAPADPIEGRWSGTVKDPGGLSIPAVMAFRKQADGYTGSISDLQTNRPMIPFREVSYEEKGKTVTVKFFFSPAAAFVEIKFALAGQSLKGSTVIRVGRTPVSLTYEFKKDFDGQVGFSAQNRAEADEFSRIRAEQGLSSKKKLVDEFLEKHPKSSITAYVLQEGAFLGRQNNDVEMMSDYGERSLAVWPDNFVLLTELGRAYVQRRKIDEAEVKATKALELLEKAAKPVQTSEEGWAAAKKMMLATNHSTLGFVHLNRAQTATDLGKRKAEYESAKLPFQKSLELEPLDEYALYGSGFSYAMLENYADAESNLAKAVVLNGPVMLLAKSMLEQVYKTRHNNTLDGLDAVLTKARSELGIKQ